MIAFSFYFVVISIIKVFILINWIVYDRYIQLLKKRMNIESLVDELEQIEQEQKKRNKSKKEQLTSMILELKEKKKIEFDDLVGPLLVIIESKNSRLYELWLSIIQKVLRSTHLNEH